AFDPAGREEVSLGGPADAAHERSHAPLLDPGVRLVAFRDDGQARIAVAPERDAELRRAVRAEERVGLVAEAAGVVAVLARVDRAAGGLLEAVAAEAVLAVREVVVRVAEHELPAPQERPIDGEDVAHRLCAEAVAGPGHQAEVVVAGGVREAELRS